MLAAQILRYGGPETLRVSQVDRPSPRPGEIQVAVDAASVNGHDVLVRSGGLRIVTRGRFPLGVGLDFAGRVTAVGPGTTRAVGDRVWGIVHPLRHHTVGTAAQYAVVPQDLIGRAPDTLDGPQAASLVVAGTTALIALRDHLKVRAGQRLLIRGAAGGVGSAAVQIASARGVHVTALASANRTAELQRLGADEVLDRTANQPKSIGPFDAILDTVGSQLGPYRRRLSRHGRMVTIAISGSSLLAVARSFVHGSRRIRVFGGNPRAADLNELAALVTDGALHPVIAAVYPLDQVAEAQRTFERGGILGKVVVTVLAG